MNKRSTIRTSRKLKESKADWRRLRAMHDSDIDMSDIPEITAATAKDGVVRLAGKVVPRGKRKAR